MLRLLVAMLLIYLHLLSACGMSAPLIIEDHQVQKTGLYEISALTDAWVRSPLGIQEQWGLSPVVWDMTYVKCPDTQDISILTARIKRQGFTPQDFESLVMDFYRHDNPFVKEILSYRTVQVNMLQALEFQYLTKNNGKRPTEFCSTGTAANKPYKSKDIIINAGFKKGFNGGHEIIILSYVAPLESSSESAREFDQMVKTFRLVSQ